MHDKTGKTFTAKFKTAGADKKHRETGMAFTSMPIQCN